MLFVFLNVYVFLLCVVLLVCLLGVVDCSFVCFVIVDVLFIGVVVVCSCVCWRCC